MTTKIVIEIESCGQCPYVITRACNYNFTFYCEKENNKLITYDHHGQNPIIPDWCPFKSDKT